jgi:hypothetical protein
MGRCVVGLADEWVAVCMESSDETVMGEIGHNPKAGSRHALSECAKTKLNTISGVDRWKKH